MEWFGKLFDIQKLPTKIVALFAIVAGTLVFSSERSLRVLHLVELRRAHDGAIGLTFLLCSALLAINVFLWAVRTLRRWWHRVRWRAGMMDEVEALSFSERCVLREFAIQGRDTVGLPLTDPTVAGLLRKGFLEQVGGFGTPSLAGPIWPMRIHREVRGALTLEVLGLPQDEPTHEDIARLRRERPGFMREILESADFGGRR